MKQIFKAVAFGLAMIPTAGLAEIVKVKASGDVPATMDALVAAVEGAGATVFARIDHAGGAMKAGMELAPEQLLLFGNPKLGTPAMQDDPLAGLHLPLRVLVYQDAEGQVWLAYEDPGKALPELGGISEDAGYLAKMRGALGKLTAKAAGVM
jgi:uncharacterized protein (DUF302 family)